MPHTPRPLVSLALLALALPVAACSERGAPFNDSITQEQLTADLHALAADSMRGRLVGTEEHDRAAEWVRARFESLGLEPAGDDGGYFQDFDLMWFSLGTRNTLTVAGAGGARRPGQGWYPADISATATASGDVAFAGFGIVEPRIGYDDYKGADLSGRIALVLDREPGVDDPDSPFDGVVTAEASRTWRKALSAQQHGAVGILFVRDVQNRGDVSDWAQASANAWPAEPRRIERFTLGAWMEEITIPAAQISVELAQRLVSGSGSSLETLAAMSEVSDDGLGVVALPDSRVSMTVSVSRHVTLGRNILAMVEGSDPELRDEVVVVGGHYDHNGADGDEIFNGADDNGSGTVGVMAVAGAYAAAADQGELPRRSVLFAVWDAEERGLLGAWYYTVAPRFPLERTAANLNMDMIGRNQEVPEDGGGRFRGLAPQTAESNANATNILGYSRTPQLAMLVDEANATYGLRLRFRYDNNESNLLRRSDHWPFIQSGVPAVWFHTGLHPDYHLVTDDADLINYEKMTRIVRLVHQASWDVANVDRPPSLEPMGPRPRS